MLQHFIIATAWFVYYLINVLNSIFFLNFNDEVLKLSNFILYV